MMAPPVRGDSVLGRVSALVLSPAFLIGPRSGAVVGEGLVGRAWGGAAAWVAASWGEAPRPATRLGGRRLVHATCLVGFGAIALPACLVLGIGLGLDQLWLQVVAAVLMVPASCFLGFDAGLSVRALGSTVDFVEWDRAGRPEAWTFRTWSQPRNADLCAAALVSALLAAFFVALMLG